MHVLTAATLSHLDRLEAESIHILREVAAGFRNPVLLSLYEMIRRKTPARV
jgi:3'-phosphoadenosine 5'-phosphosulfate sulfotransferase (PAPS reductase)/FAD synthetase